MSSSYLFLSSPPQQSHTQKYQQQTSFFTPQVHRTNTASNWFTFQPKSPSPLRTSTFGNVMRHQDYSTGSKQAGSGVGLEDVGENVKQENGWEEQEGRLSTPFLDSKSTINTTTPITEPLFSTADTSSSSSRGTPFTFQQRARDSSASGQMSSRIQGNRTGRKTGFLDRLRTSRRDQRDNRGIESFEKEEYWRERRAREENLRRQARAQNITEEGDAELETYEDEYDVGLDMNDGELSPVDEEKELAELVDGYYHGNDGLRLQEDDFMDDNFEDDPEYEQAFMEVMSQEEPSGRQVQQMGSLGQCLSFDSGGYGGIQDASLPGRQETQQTQCVVQGECIREGDMDMS